MIYQDSATRSASGWRDRLFGARTLLERFPLSVLQLLFCICIAAVFWKSGLTKIASWQTTVVLFRDEYKVPLLPPELAATFGAAVEITPPGLLLLRPATPPSPLPLLGIALLLEVVLF